VIPEGPEAKGDPRGKQPVIPAAKSFTPPLPTQFTLKNGIKVFYWNRPQLPLMSMETYFKAGADIDPASKAGRSDLMADMLDEGAGSRTAQQFQDALDQLGASFGASAGHLSSTTSMSVISANFGQALALYGDALLRPRFDPTEWARVKRTSVANLQQALDDPSYVARTVAMREFYGPANPYGRPVSGSAATVQALNLTDIKTSYQMIFQPDNATFFVAGSIPQAQVQSMLNQTFGSWKQTRNQKLPPVGYPGPAVNDLKVFIVDKPGAVQTVIRFVLPGIPYEDPKRLTYGALGTILGGSFTSRLNQNLREAKGYTYGAGSSYTFELPLGYFVASAAVRADVTGASIDEFLKEMKGIQAGNVTPQEAAKAASIERAGVVESMSSLESLLGTAMSLYAEHRPFSDLAKELSAIASIDAAKINGLAQSAIDLGRGVLVLVGDKATILKQLEGKGLPTPKVVNP
jgi:predicted Zn-dependent peptidase